jgi:hypothetical protein
VPVSVLTDLERRTLGNLSIPRNMRDLAGELTRDRHTPYGLGEQEKLGRLAGGEHVLGDDPSGLDKLVKGLIKEGLIIDIGEFKDPSKVAAKVADGFKGSLDLRAGDDQRVENYINRLSTPARRWRTEGNLLMLTEAGLEKLREPIGPVTTMTPSEVARELMRHRAAVKDLPIKGSIFDPDGGYLAPEVAAKHTLAAGMQDPYDPTRQVATMLMEEYEHWARLVSEECKRVWGVYPDPVAAGYFDATEDLIQAADAGGTAYGETSPTFFALTILAFTDVDTGTTADNGSHIPTYTGYARKSTTNTDLGTSSAGTRSNANAIIWAACTAGSSTILGAGRMVAATVGRAIRYLTVASTSVSATQTPAQFAAAALTDTLD